jgi:hypothetical protein
MTVTLVGLQIQSTMHRSPCQSLRAELFQCAAILLLKLRHCPLIEGTGRGEGIEAGNWSLFVINLGDKTLLVFRVEARGCRARHPRAWSSRQHVALRFRQDCHMRNESVDLFPGALHVCRIKAPFFTLADRVELTVLRRPDFF